MFAWSTRSALLHRLAGGMLAIKIGDHGSEHDHVPAAVTEALPTTRLDSPVAGEAATPGVGASLVEGAELWSEVRRQVTGFGRNPLVLGGGRGIELGHRTHAF